MATLRSLWRGIREDSRLTVINRKEGVSWACRAPARPARLRDGNSPQGEGEPRRVCEQCRKGIRAACGKLTWGTAEGRPVDQRQVNLRTGAERTAFGPLTKALR